MADELKKKGANGPTEGPGAGGGAGGAGEGTRRKVTHARAVSALQKMAKPQPRATDLPPLEELGGLSAAGGGEGSASGFVGMLAKGQIGAGPGGAGPGGTGAGMEGLDAGDSRMPPRTKYSLQMARELSPDVLRTRLSDGQNLEEAVGSAARAGGDAARARREMIHQKRARQNRIVVPVIFGLAGVLLAIGFWAIGAVIYMANVSPIAAEDVHYPLIAWSLDVGNMGGYTAASRMMGYAMLACVPVAVGLLALAETLRRRSRK